MRKIPTVFRRDPDDMRHVLGEVTPGCEWVLAGEGVPTRKYDGTCVRLDENGRWLARREVKPGKQAPPNFLPLQTDDATGKTVGWEPVEQSGFAKWHAEALANASADQIASFAPGTYELCGPKVNGNPERFEDHRLVAHSGAETVRASESPFRLIQYCAQEGWEGIVWHHPDGRMAKLKVRDYAR